MLNRRPAQADQTSDLHKTRGNRVVLFSSPNLVGSCYSSERQQIALLQEAGIPWSHQDSAKSLAPAWVRCPGWGKAGSRREQRIITALIFLSAGALPLNSRYHYNNYKAKNKINSKLLAQCGIVPCVFDSSIMLLLCHLAHPEPGLRCVTLIFTIFCCHEMC